MADNLSLIRVTSWFQSTSSRCTTPKRRRRSCRIPPNHFRKTRWLLNRHGVSLLYQR